MISQSNRNQIKMMCESGISNQIISRRMHNLGVDISEVQVGRILKEMRVRRGAPMLDRMLGTEFEHALWRVCYDTYGSFRDVADRFGVSHETVRIKLSGRQ